MTKETKLTSQDLMYYAAKVNNVLLEAQMSLTGTQALEVSDIIRMSKEVYEAFEKEIEKKEESNGNSEEVHEGTSGEG